MTSLDIILPSLSGTKTSLPSSPTITGTSFLTGPPSANPWKLNNFVGSLIRFLLLALLNSFSSKGSANL